MEGSIFGWDRIYYDGTCQRLSTRPEVVRFLLDRKVPITYSIPEDLRKQKNIALFLSQEQNSFLQECCERFRLGPFVEFFEVESGYYDQFCFHTNKDITHAASNCWQKKEEIEGFIRILRNDSPWVKREKSDLITLPVETRGEIPRFKELAKTLTVQKGQNQWAARLSDRELDCTALIFLGLTAAEIGSTLGLSPRTVESYTDNIKNKLGVSKKGQISAAAVDLQNDPFMGSRFRETIKKLRLASIL